MSALLHECDKFMHGLHQKSHLKPRIFAIAKQNLAKLFLYLYIVVRTTYTVNYIKN